MNGRMPYCGSAAVYAHVCPNRKLSLIHIADTDAAVRLRDVDADAAALTVIFDGVFAEVIDDLIKEAARTDDLRALAVDGEGDLARLRRALKVVRGLVCDSAKVDRFARDVDALVELAEADDVADERDAALRLVTDVADEARDVLFLDPVSYTHLDVYKRPAKTRPAACSADAARAAP